MPFFVGALNALCSFQFGLVRLWVCGAKIEIFFFCAWEKNWIFFGKCVFLQSKRMSYGIIRQYGRNKSLNGIGAECGLRKNSIFNAIVI